MKHVKTLNKANLIKQLVHHMDTAAVDVQNDVVSVHLVTVYHLFSPVLLFKKTGTILSGYCCARILREKGLLWGLCCGTVILLLAFSPGRRRAWMVLTASTVFS